MRLRTNLFTLKAKNMATLRTYRCKCGYEVQTEPTGHYGLFAGEFYNFRCTKCKEIRVFRHLE